MRLLFLGTCKFEDRSSGKISNPFEDIKDCLDLGDIIFLNMDGIISSRDFLTGDKLKSDGEQLLSLKRLVPHIPIVVNFKNDVVLQHGVKGLKDTEKFLAKHDFVFNVGVLRPLVYGNLCMFNFTDLELLNNLDAMEYTVPVNINHTYNDVLSRVVKSHRKPFRRIVVCLKFKHKRIFDYTNFDDLAKKLVENGADVVFGYGSSNIPLRKSCFRHQGGLIIRSLGDLVNCNVDPRKIYINKGEMCLYNTVSKQSHILEISRHMVEDCLLPKF